MRPTVSVTIQDGSRIVVPDELGVITTFVLREQEDWFEDEIHFVRKMVFPGMKSIDIGASYGLYTVVLAKGSGESGQVISFEPTPETAFCLAETLRLNGIYNVDLKPMAISGSSGSRRLCFGSSSEHNYLGKNSELDSESSHIDVSASSIDDIRNTLPEKIDFMKIDAEGEEEFIFRGARSFLQEESPLVMFELNDETRYNSNLFNLLHGWGYQTYRLLPGLNILVPLPLKSQLPKYLFNVFCCKLDRALRLSGSGLLLIDEESRANINVEVGAWALKCSSVASTQVYVNCWIQAASEPTVWLKKYLNALDLVAMAENEKLSAEVRVIALKKSAMLLSMLCDVEPTVPRLSTLARVQTALGEKISGCETIQKAINLCHNLEFEPGAEPFYLPSKHLEWRKPGKDSKNFLVVALFEQLQRLYCISTIICPRFYLDIVDDFVIRKMLTPELERRRQLALMVLKLQENPQSSELLGKLAPDNMNPEYWNKPESKRKTSVCIENP